MNRRSDASHGDLRAADWFNLFIADLVNPTLRVDLWTSMAGKRDKAWVPLNQVAQQS